MNEEKNSTENPDSFKVVLLGESGEGKTSILNRFIKNTFVDNIVSTAGVCFLTKIIEIPTIKKYCKLDVNYIIYNIIINVNFRFGIQLVKKDIKVSRRYIIKKVRQ